MASRKIKYCFQKLDEMSFTCEKLHPLKNTYQIVKVLGSLSSSHAFCLGRWTPAGHDPPTDEHNTITKDRIMDQMQ